ncbi:flagellar biosynthesis protein FlhA [Mobiluncus mulieris]|uniref:flagellar biosynthesis protein FlhA n=1 Tax=Mobiluncus mulieris TaxID=2052 RepID=UPI0021E2FEB3|nr:flagellar biosynthesis protein FlhA [Mobiluncus mulieris]MCV0001847.1 flagellar biosynthesis protein FlhA [Mobiluncus mulieris]
MKFDFKMLSRLAMPIGVVGIVMLLVFPLKPWLIDILFVLSIMLSMIALLTTMFVEKPLNFSVFPTLVLVATLFRLGLNIASTRLILTPGSGGGSGKAGQVIEAFGTFVVGGNFVVGMVVFIILVIINFVVITNGAGRVAEVGARFTLDAMPGKQMAIDADLNSGLIDEETARARRAEIASEADFYGAMDGGSKFVKGDAIAGIVITIVNLIAGFIIGMAIEGMNATDSIATYSQLTVGDGLVSQIPSLLMSLATGVIVTRSKDSPEGGIGGDFTKQLSQSFSALMIAGIAAILMGLVPAMPKLPFLVVGALLVFGGWKQLSALKRAETEEEVMVEEDETKPAGETPEQLIEQMRVPVLEILLSPDLIDLVGANTDTDLLARVRGLRRKVALESGFVLPPVRTRDSVDLPVSTYVIRMSGVEVGRGIAPPGKVLALGDALDDLPGDLTQEPVFGLAGKWIPVELRYNAELSGATVVDRVSVLITHLSALVSENAARLLSREDVRILVDGVRQTNPSAVEELIPAMLSLGEVQVVLQGLLEEQVPILDLPRIFEALSVRAKQTTDPEQLIEAARAELGPSIVSKYVMEGVLRVITLDPMFEQSLLETVRPGDEGSQLALDPDRMEDFLNQTREVTEQAEQSGFSVVLVCAPVLRPALRKLVNLGIARLPVLSYTEVSGAKVMIETMGTISGSHAISG